MTQFAKEVKTQIPKVPTSSVEVGVLGRQDIFVLSPSHRVATTPFQACIASSHPRARGVQLRRAPRIGAV